MKEVFIDDIYTEDNVDNIERKISFSGKLSYTGYKVIEYEMSSIDSTIEGRDEASNIVWEETIDISDFKSWIDRGRMKCSALNRYKSSNGELIHFILWYSTDGGRLYRKIKHYTRSDTSWRHLAYNDIDIPSATTHIKAWVNAYNLQDEKAEIKVNPRMMRFKYI